MKRLQLVTGHGSRVTVRGQSTVEYAVLAAVVVGALLVMQIYMKRGVSGKLRESVDQVGEQFTPLTATYAVTKTYSSKRVDTAEATGGTKTSLTNETRGRTGTENPVGTDMAQETLF